MITRIDVTCLRANNCVEGQFHVITMPFMPQKGKKKPVPATAATTKPRKGSAKTFWIDDDLDAALNRYLEDQEVEPKQKAIFAAALRMFLASKGYWPPKSEQP